jgi:hypothetical protein
MFLRSWFGKPEAFRKECGRAARGGASYLYGSGSESQRLSARKAAEPQRRSLISLWRWFGKPEAFRKECGRAAA